MIPNLSPAQQLAQYRQQATPQRIPLGKLAIDERYQVRLCGLSRQHITDLRLSDSSTCPPLFVVQQYGNQGQMYGIVGGAHRYATALELDLPDLPCIVLPVDPDDLETIRALAMADNAGHGKKMLPREKRVYAWELFDKHPDWTPAHIAKLSYLPTRSVQDMLLRSKDRREADRQKLQRLIERYIQHSDDLGSIIRTTGEEYDDNDDLSDIPDLALGMANDYLARWQPRRLPYIINHLEVTAEFLINVANRASEEASS